MRLPRLHGPAGEAGAGGQGIGVPGTEYLLQVGQQGGVLVAGGGRAAGLPGPGGEAGSGAAAADSAIAAMITKT